VADADEVDEVGVSSAVVDVLQFVHLGHQGDDVILGQAQGERRDQAAFNGAIADDRDRRGHLDIGNDGEADGAAVIAEQVDLGPQEDIAEPCAMRLAGAGCAVEGLLGLQTVELDFKIRPVGDAYFRLGSKASKLCVVIRDIWNRCS